MHGTPRQMLATTATAVDAINHDDYRRLLSNYDLPILHSLQLLVHWQPSAIITVVLIERKTMQNQQKIITSSELAPAQESCLGRSPVQGHTQGTSIADH